MNFSLPMLICLPTISLVSTQDLKSDFQEGSRGG